MSRAAPARPPAPAPPGRLESLDRLRGIAALGIFMMNIQAFAMAPQAYDNPLAHMSFEAADQAVWRVQQAVFATKFITIFSALFGAGLALSLGPEPDAERLARQKARLGWLLVFGLLHGFVFWHGDVLAPYAVAGWIALGAVDRGPRALLGLAGGLFGLSVLLVLALETAVAQAPAAERAASLAESWAPAPEAIAALETLYRSDWLSRWPAHALLNGELLLVQTTVMLPRLLAAMFAGMALVKLGFFSGAARPRLLRGLAWSAGGLGIALSLIAAEARLRLGFDYAAGIGWRLLADAAAPLAALGYAAAATAWPPGGPLAGLRAALADVGRLALSVYLLSTLIGFFLFYGPPGLGLFGRVERPGQAAIVVVVWVVFLVAAPLWRRRFGAGPFERLWRRLAARSAASGGGSSPRP